MNETAWKIIKDCFGCIGVMYVLTVFFGTHTFKQILILSIAAFIMVVVLLLVGKFFFST